MFLRGKGFSSVCTAIWQIFSFLAEAGQPLQSLLPDVFLHSVSLLPGLSPQAGTCYIWHKFFFPVLFFPALSLCLYSAHNQGGVPVLWTG